MERDAARLVMPESLELTLKLAAWSLEQAEGRIDHERWSDQSVQLQEALAGASDQKDHCVGAALP